jgi:hypothetical protein
MVDFTREEAVSAAEQFLSGLARYAECFFGEGAAKRLLGLADEQTLEPEFLSGQTMDASQAYADPADYSAFEFRIAISYLYDFAFQGNASDLDALIEFHLGGQPFWEVMEHKSRLVDRMANDLVNERSIQTLLTVYHAAEARLALMDENPFDYDYVRLDRLAALSGVSIKTLRNAATNAGKHPLRTSKSGKDTVVERQDALAWLRSRPDYHETQIGGAPQVQSYSSPNQLGIHLATLCSLRKSTIEEIANQADLKPAILQALRKLITCSPDDDLSTISMQSLHSLAAPLGIENRKAFALEAYKPICIHQLAQQANQLSDH